MHQQHASQQQGPSPSPSPAPLPPLGGASPSFSVLQDKPLSGQVLLASWCPAMDLLALVTLDNQLAIHRLDWQKLWVACVGTPITALGWKPDGKEVVTGHRDGSIRHYNVERCEVCHESASPSGPHAGAAIDHLSWVEADAGMASTPILQHLKYRHTRFFTRPPLASDPSPKPPTAEDLDMSQAAQRAAACAAEWPAAPQALYLLISCDVRGVACISAYGQLQLATLDVRAAAGLAGGAVQLQAHLSRDLRSLVALVQPDPPPPLAPAAVESPRSVGTFPRAPPTHTQAQQGGGALSSPAGTSAAAAGMSTPGPAGVAAGGGPKAALQVLVYSCPQLVGPQIQQLTVLAIHLREVLAAAQHGMASALREWQTSQQELRKRLNQLAQCLRDHATSGGEGDADWQEDEELVEGELMCLLASGLSSPGMTAFLSHTLAEHGLRRLAKVVDGAVQAVHALLLDQVQPAIEVATFLLGEVKGLALAGSGCLGLQGGLVCHAELEAAKALLQVEALRLAVTTVGSKLRSFFNWLHRTWYQLEGIPRDPAPPAGAPTPTVNTSTNIQDIMDLLAGHLAHDAILQDLQEAVSLGSEGLPVASLSFPPSQLLEQAKLMMQLMYSPLIPPDVAAQSPHLASAAQQQHLFASPSTSPTAGLAATQQQHHSSALSLSPSTSPNAGAQGSVAAGTPAMWPSRPLRVQLKQLSALCERVLGGPSAALSPSLMPVLQLPITDAPAPAGPLLCCNQVPQLKTDPRTGAVRVCVALPASSMPSLASGLSTDPVASLASERDTLLVVEVGEALQVAGAAGAVAPGAANETAVQGVRAGLLTMPLGWVVEDLAFYRASQLGLLVSARGGAAEGAAGRRQQDAGGRQAMGEDGGASGGSSSSLVLVPLEEQPPRVWARVEAGTAGGCLLQACVAQAAVSPLPHEGLKARACPQGSYVPPLALSAPRGVAALFSCSDRMRAYMVDLEEDEEAGGKEEEEDGGVEEAGQEGEGEDREGVGERGNSSDRSMEV